MNLLSPLCDTYDAELVENLFACHRVAARANQNASSVAAQIAWHGSRNMTQAIIAALATTGETHAPVAEVRSFLFFDLPNAFWPINISSLVAHGHRIAGFGNSFYKDQVDPAFHPIEARCREFCPQLNIIQKELWKCGKKIYPNAAAFTAIVAEKIGLRTGCEILLFALPRLAVWADLATAEQS